MMLAPLALLNCNYFVERFIDRMYGLVPRTRRSMAFAPAQDFMQNVKDNRLERMKP